MIKLLIAAILFTGAVSGCATWSQESLIYTPQHSGYTSKELGDVSDGWVQITDSKGKAALNAPYQLNPDYFYHVKEAEKQSKKPALHVEHYLKAWYHPNKKLVFVQNLFYQTEKTFKKNVPKDPNNITYTFGVQQYSFAPVGQTLFLLDLETGVGFGAYNGYLNGENLAPPVIQRAGLACYISQGLHIYKDPKEFFCNNNIKNIFYREIFYSGSEEERISGDLNFIRAGTVTGKGEFFSFVSGYTLWHSFLNAAKENGGDEAKWSKWDVHGFFVETLKIHSPGIYLNGIDYNPIMFGNEECHLPPNKFIFSKESGPFSRSISELSSHQKEQIRLHRDENRLANNRLYNRVNEVLMLRK